MLNRIIRFSLENKYLIIFAFVLIFAGGLYTISRTNVDVFPDLNAPTVTVMTEAPGLAPDEVERLVSYPIETALNGATGVRRVRSSSDMGLSVVIAEFEWGTDVYIDRQIVSEKLMTIADALPPNVGTPVMTPQTSIMGEVMIIGLTSDKTSGQELRTIADRVLKPQLLSLSGVAQVTVMGGDIKEYQILLDPERMRYYNVTVDEVLEATEGINNNSNGGILYEHDNEYLIKSIVNTTDVDAIGQSVIRSDENGIVRVSDIAEVKIGSEFPKLGLATECGKPAVLVTVSKQNETNTLELTEAVENSLAELKKNLPADVNISTNIFRQSDFIDNSISNIQSALLEGALFVIIILFLFLMDVRATVISVLALPISVIITLVVLHIMGLSINTMSLGGIAIAIGSLVDDAIVDVENVYRRLRLNRQLPAGEWLSIKEVIFEASSEVRRPILNSTLIIIASFLPLFFLSGIEGRLLIPLGIAFIIALIASTVVALTLTPVLCNVLLAKDKHLGSGSKEAVVSRKMKEYYAKSLLYAMRHKKVLLTSVGGLFVVALLLTATLGRGFLPPFNEGSFTINLTTLPGISLEESNKIGEQADQMLLSIPEIKTIARKTGRAELDEHSRGTNSSEIEAPYEIIDRPREEIAKEIREKLSLIPGLSVEVGQPISHRIDAMLSGTEAQIAIKIFGDDLDQLLSLGNKVKKTISEIPGIVDVNMEQQVQRPEIEILPKRELMAKYGVTVPALNKMLNASVSGIVVSEVYDKGVPYNLVVRVKDESRATLENVRNLLIDTNVGKVPLMQVAEVKSSTTYNSVSRENARRRIVVSANVSNRDLVGAVNEIREKIDASVPMPEGYYVNYGGQFESQEAASRTLGAATLLALLVILILLYQEFHNMRESLIILVNIPLAMIGGVLILWINGGELNIPAIIGFISLLGITTRNGMLLMSRYRQLQEEGFSLMERIKMGSSDRLLPIVMTALTSALALIPIVLRGTEPGNEIQSPMAAVILGGLFSSTLLNVFIVPIIYYLNCRKKEEAK